MSNYKRIKGINFVVDYPSHIWNGLSIQEQSEIAKFYNKTYGKKIASQARKNGRANGATNGRNLASHP